MVYVAIWTHEYGTDVAVAPSEEAARKWFASVVKAWAPFDIGEDTAVYVDIMKYLQRDEIPKAIDLYCNYTGEVMDIQHGEMLDEDGTLNGKVDV